MNSTIDRSTLNTLREAAEAFAERAETAADADARAFAAKVRAALDALNAADKRR